ncbi:MAG: hypothetical protein K5648_08100 [Erysipelotrichaceae bacterium]|nr:hypothetical protein [Erysipelotrichaceae bacterium]
MKKILTIMLTLLLCMSFYPINAEEGEDMSKFSFKILLQHADQLDELKVVRFYNKESGRYAFCMEPLVDYSPKDNLYEKQNCDDKKIFEIYKAFEILGEEYYIAAQLMIWEITSGVRYSFDGKDSKDFGEEKILETIGSFEEETEVKELSFSFARQQIHTLSIKGLDEYEIAETDVQILKKEGDTVTLQMSDHEETIRLVPKCSLMDKSFRYHSESSQDLYSYEGDYEVKPKMKITLFPADELYSYSFSKTDEYGTPIPGAGFTLFSIDEHGGEEILLIKAGRKVDLSNVYMQIQNDTEVKTSERYQKYFDGTEFYTDEVGCFPYEIKDTSIRGHAFVCKDFPMDGDLLKLNVKKEKEFFSDASIKQTLSDVSKDQTYLLAETNPAKGYTFGSDPCIYIGMDAPEMQFINKRRDFDLKLCKENEEHSILLNDATFEISYVQGGEERTVRCVSGALNIFNDEDQQHVFYRHENEENIYVGEFENGSFILKNARPGKYYYRITDRQEADSKSLNRETYVSEGAICIKDIPYDAKITVTELQAPNGYYIEEPTYEIDADLDYGEITFKNFRVNRFDIYGRKKHKIPKTCIGN